MKLIMYPQSHKVLKPFKTLTNTTSNKKTIWAEKSSWAEQKQLFLDRFKTCFDTVKSKISQNAAIPAKKYGFTKQKHIRGDKTLKIYNFGPNVNIIA